MAIATLERCYDNYDVFRRVVKIRKGEAVRLMRDATDMRRVNAIMTQFLLKVRDAILTHFLLPKIVFGYNLVHVQFLE